MQARERWLVSRLLWFGGMKAAVLVATSCLFASTARASPAWTVDVGGHVGASDDVIGFGGALGAGQRLFDSGNGSVWTHETLVATSLVGPFLFGHGSGALFRGSAGLEFQLATSEGSRAYFLCGIEAGYARLDYEGVDEGLFGPSTPVSHHERGPIGVVRLGVHFGGESVGIEPVLELVPHAERVGGQLGLNMVFSW